MPNITLLDVARSNGSDEVVGLVEENIAVTPELQLLPVRTIVGTGFKTLLRTGLPSTSFIAASEGVDPSKSTFENKYFDCGILGGRVEVWKTILDSPENGPAADIKATEASGILESALRTVGRQIFYGTTDLGSAKGFPGLVNFVHSSMIHNADGNAANAGSSVYLVKFGPQHVQLIMGNNGTFELGDWRVESLTDANGKKGPGEVADLASWIGLQCVSQHSVVRIKNLTSQTGKGLTDTLLADALDKFPVGIVPDAIFMTRRSRTQLRKSRTVVLNGSGKERPDQPNIAPTPTEYEGIPIFATDSLLDSEPIA